MNFSFNFFLLNYFFLSVVLFFVWKRECLACSEMLAQRAKEEAKRSEMNKRSDREGKQQIVSCPLCFLPFRAATIDDHVRIHFLDVSRMMCFLFFFFLFFSFFFFFSPVCLIWRFESLVML